MLIVNIEKLHEAPPHFAGAPNLPSLVTRKYPWLVDIGSFSFADSNIFHFSFSAKGVADEEYMDFQSVFEIAQLEVSEHLA